MIHQHKELPAFFKDKPEKLRAKQAARWGITGPKSISLTHIYYTAIHLSNLNLIRPSTNLINELYKYYRNDTLGDAREYPSLITSNPNRHSLRRIAGALMVISYFEARGQLQAGTIVRSRYTRGEYIHYIFYTLYNHTYKRDVVGFKEKVFKVIENTLLPAARADGIALARYLEGEGMYIDTEFRKGEQSLKSMEAE